jgi:hypothetical protein
MLELGCFAGSMVVPTILLFFLCFFSRSGLLECWISLAWDAVILTLDVGFICPVVVIDPTY